MLNLRTLALSAAAAALLAATAPAARTDAVTSSLGFMFPPESSAIYRALSPIAINTTILDNMKLHFALDGVSDSGIGHIDYAADGGTGTTDLTDLGGPQGSMALSIFFAVGRAINQSAIGNPGSFPTELLAMQLIGFPPGNSTSLMLRESPQLPSFGEMNVTAIGGGLFHIDSFFDVFTELSLDGGRSWIPDDNATRFVLEMVQAQAAEPICVAIFGLGLAAFAVRARRRR